MDQIHKRSSNEWYKNDDFPYITDIVKEMLGVAIHELLYVRKLYPMEVFESCRYLGIEVHAARHPTLSNYIDHMLDVSVPALCDGGADALYFVIMEGDGEEVDGVVVERYTFEFDVDHVHEQNERGEMHIFDGSVNDEDRRQAILVGIEKSFRNFILKIISLEANQYLDHRRRSEYNSHRRKEEACSEMRSSRTFKLCLRKCSQMLSQKNSDSVKLLEDFITNGSWKISNGNHYAFPKSSNGCRTPLKDIHVPSCGIHMNLALDYLPEDAISY